MNTYSREAILRDHSARTDSNLRIIKWWSRPDTPEKVELSRRKISASIFGNAWIATFPRKIQSQQTTPFPHPQPSFTTLFSLYNRLTPPVIEWRVYRMRLRVYRSDFRALNNFARLSALVHWDLLRVRPLPERFYLGILGKSVDGRFLECEEDFKTCGYGRVDGGNLSPSPFILAMGIDCIASEI